MKKNLEILEIEAKLTKDEKKYWRVKTAKGWMSVFDVVAKDTLKEFMGKTACCEVTEKKGTNYRGEETIFYNITKCYGEAEVLDGQTHTDPQFEKPEVVKIGTNGKKEIGTNNHTTMYVSYVKDLLLKDWDVDKAIEAIKKAEEAFE